MTELMHQALTERIIGIYYSVYNRLGQAFPETIYERAMMVLLERWGIPCVRQDEYEILYKDRLVGMQRLDIFVAGNVVVELKVAPEITRLHQAQLLSYIKTVSQEVGLLFRFGGPKPQFVRHVLTPSSWQATLSPAASVVLDGKDMIHPDLASEIVLGTLEVYRILGPGFIHRIYANSCLHELTLRGLDVILHHDFRVFMDDIDLGTINLAHLQVDNRALVFPVATSNIDGLRNRQPESMDESSRYPHGYPGQLQNHSTRSHRSTAMSPLTSEDVLHGLRARPSADTISYCHFWSYRAPPIRGSPIRAPPIRGSPLGFVCACGIISQ